MAKNTKFTKERIEKAISEAGPHLKSLAEMLNVTPRTIRNYLDRFELWDVFESNQKLMKMIAASNVNHALEEGDVDTSKWVLERLGKDEGWVKRGELTGANGASFGLSAELVKMLIELNQDPVEVLKEFDKVIKAQYEAKKKSESG